jgi:gas vesicle protein
MADGYDGFDNERDGYGGGAFMMGLVTGAVIGAGLGLLFAPKTGSELRRQLGEQADNLANTTSETYRKASAAAADLAGKAQKSAGEWAGKASDAADDLAERGKDLYGKARDAVAKGADEAERYVKDARDSGASSFGSGSTVSHSMGPRSS